MTEFRLTLFAMALELTELILGQLEIMRDSFRAVSSGYTAELGHSDLTKDDIERIVFKKRSADTMVASCEALLVSFQSGGEFLSRGSAAVFLKALQEFIEFHRTAPQRFDLISEVDGSSLFVSIPVFMTDLAAEDASRNIRA